MCFGGDANGPDIWLTVENGKYAPAPPLVYVPGLRRVHDRIHQKGYHNSSQCTWGSDFVRLPVTSTMPTSIPRSSFSDRGSPPVHSAASCLPQALPEEQGPEPASVAITDQNASASSSEPNDNLPDSLPSPQMRREKPTEEPSNVSPKFRQQMQRDGAISANENAPASADSADSSTSTDFPCSPSTSSSSLRSILKKPTRPEAEEAASGKAGNPSEKDNQEEGMTSKKSRRPKTKKSVSFVEETAPPLSIPTASRAPQMTAAEEGAAIAKKLVEEDAASRSGVKPCKTIWGWR